MGDLYRLVVKNEWRLGRKGNVWELPSGWQEGGDSPENTAVKELQQEAGLFPHRTQLLLSSYLWNHASTRFHFVLATELENKPLAPDEHEHVITKRLSLSRARKLLLEQQIPSLQLIVAFYLLDHRTAL